MRQSLITKHIHNASLASLSHFFIDFSSEQWTNEQWTHFLNTSYFTTPGCMKRTSRGILRNFIFSCFFFCIISYNNKDGTEYIALQTQSTPPPWLLMLLPLREGGGCGFLEAASSALAILVFQRLLPIGNLPFQGPFFFFFFKVVFFFSFFAA